MAKHGLTSFTVHKGRNRKARLNPSYNKLTFIGLSDYIDTAIFLDTLLFVANSIAWANADLSPSHENFSSIFAELYRKLIDLSEFLVGNLVRHVDMGDGYSMNVDDMS